MRIIAIGLNVVFLAIIGTALVLEGMGSDKFWEVILKIIMIATPIASLISLGGARPIASLVSRGTSGPATWLSLWLKRKTAEERLRLRDIELALSGDGHADGEAHNE